MATGEVTFRMDDKEITVNVNQIADQQEEHTECFQLDFFEELEEDEHHRPHPGIEQVLVQSIE
ncbi:hypothetical protein A2U01_0079584, partial [Trifolium medium]|nr:hypothetical protein [Trifolium medium]